MTFILPLVVTLPRKRKADKRVSLTLNWYRNAHHHESAAVKLLFEPISAELWEGYAPRIRISYEVRHRTRARFDPMNFAAVVDKFFCDWLVNHGLIEDDDSTRVEYGRIVGLAGSAENICIAEVEII